MPQEISNNISLRLLNPDWMLLDAITEHAADAPVTICTWVSVLNLREKSSRPEKPYLLFHAIYWQLRAKIGK